MSDTWAKVKHSFKKFIIILLVLAFLLNYPLELAQASLYKDFSYKSVHIAFCALASIADVIMVILL